MQKKGGRQHPDDRYSKVAPGSPESLARGMLPSSPPLLRPWITQPWQCAGNRV